MAILTTSVSWLDWGVELRADPRHAEGIVMGVGLTRESKTKSLDAPGKERPDEEEGDSEEMTVADAKRYRVLAVRANCLGLNRVDVQCSAKEAYRRMSKPLARDWAHFKRLAR